MYSNLSYNVLKKRDIHTREVYLSCLNIWGHLATVRSISRQIHPVGSAVCPLVSHLFLCSLVSDLCRGEQTGFSSINLVTKEWVILQVPEILIYFHILQDKNICSQIANSVTPQFANTLYPKSIDFVATLCYKFGIRIALIPASQAHSLNSVRISY